jgi:hypothetical protein
MTVLLAQSTPSNVSELAEEGRTAESCIRAVEFFSYFFVPKAAM